MYSNHGLEVLSVKDTGFATHISLSPDPAKTNPSTRQRICLLCPYIDYDCLGETGEHGTQQRPRGQRMGAQSDDYMLEAKVDAFVAVTASTT